MIKRVRELPAGRGIPGHSMVERDVREFLRNTIYDVAEVTVEGKTAQQVTSALRHYIRKHPDQCVGIGAAQRDNRAYLYRKGVE